MRAVIQRVTKARVVVAHRTVGSIDAGVAVLLAVHHDDGDRQIQWLAEKIINLRIFSDSDGRMNRSLADIGGEMLIVSQFTLYGDCRKGRRPSYHEAAPPARARELYERFIKEVAHHGTKTATGCFGAEMELSVTNDGPVTIIIDTPAMNP
ncbi:MAG: D-tyrosyl-tRNA(Tyr) deacylase [Desulfofustis sp. PB-SRB1]|jgi:D-tyrosyl-tRNA(Tyr) deacylase|nr:D-tyrosyl-tRNA(Tyr) deacylase [Desulfofustis sp. PB-SRB1]MBM1004086.1 D-tyrosyl-tRNA(Tyr) deacylase [Desulfofustis sp. PB-SRB1]HBH27610.1 D-tyrosyl-tRNA(Tyr) deacylase [Desulfofustis sp.]HBH32846.1 D-tyrosyl-tRNA(Tyr) deacylase [Desulfofustis sp.]